MRLNYIFYTLMLSVSFFSVKANFEDDLHNFEKCKSINMNYGKIYNQLKSKMGFTSDQASVKQETSKPEIRKFTTQEKIALALMEGDKYAVLTLLEKEEQKKKNINQKPNVELDNVSGKSNTQIPDTTKVLAENKEVLIADQSAKSAQVKQWLSDNRYLVLGGCVVVGVSIASFYYQK